MEIKKEEKEKEKKDEGEEEEEDEEDEEEEDEKEENKNEEKEKEKEIKPKEENINITTTKEETKKIEEENKVETIINSTNINTNNNINNIVNNSNSNIKINNKDNDNNPPKAVIESPSAEAKDNNTNKDNIVNTDNNINSENQEQEESELDLTTTYILKYTRKGDELKELSAETGLRKSENCLFMLNIKLVKSDLVSVIDPREDKTSQIAKALQLEKETPKGQEYFLVFCCHEIAAIYFDEIYERLYTLNDLASENKYFKVFESTKEAKMVIDESIRMNEKNAKKIFLRFKDKELKLHMKLSFFDKEKEIILNIPKKILNDEDKLNLLPEFLKEIQEKMNHLNEENKKLKSKKLVYMEKSKEVVYNYKNNMIKEENKLDEVNLKEEKKNKNESEANNKGDKTGGDNTVKKKVKKGIKVIKKKRKVEENFF